MAVHYAAGISIAMAGDVLCRDEFPERPRQLPKVRWRHGGVNQPHFTCARGGRSIEIGAEKLIPNRPDFTKVDLRVLKLPFVMPAVVFGHTKDMPQRAKRIVQVGVLKAKVNAQNGHPGGHCHGCCAQQDKQAEGRRSHN